MFSLLASFVSTDSQWWISFSTQIFKSVSKVTEIALVLPSICDWSRNLAPLYQPIICKIETNHDLVSRVFPRFREFGCFHFEFSLALQGILIFSDYFGCGFTPRNRKTLFTIIQVFLNDPGDSGGSASWGFFFTFVPIVNTNCFL